MTDKTSKPIDMNELKNQTLPLSDEDRNTILRANEQPPEANDKLKKAAERYREEINAKNKK